MGYESLMGEKSEGTAIAEKPDEQMSRGGWGDQKMGNPNVHHLGIERAINELDASIGVLLHKIQPALGPDVSTTDEDVKDQSERRKSVVADQVHKEMLRIRELAELIQRTAERVEV